MPFAIIIAIGIVTGLALAYFSAPVVLALSSVALVVVATHLAGFARVVRVSAAMSFAALLALVGREILTLTPAPPGDSIVASLAASLTSPPLVIALSIAAAATSLVAAWLAPARRRESRRLPYYRNGYAHHGSSDGEESIDAGSILVDAEVAQLWSRSVGSAGGDDVCAQPGPLAPTSAGPDAGDASSVACDDAQDVSSPND